MALSSGLAVAQQYIHKTCLIDQLHTMLTALVIKLSAMDDDNIKLYVVAVTAMCIFRENICHGGD